jgi:hypothetical protein
MAKPFDPRKVLKQIANSLLREFFTRRGELADVPWDQLSEHRIEPVFAGWLALSDAKQREVQMIIRDVNELADHRGVAVLAEGILARHPDRAEDFSAHRSKADKAMWSYLYAPEVFNDAAMFARADALTGGRLWNRRNGLPKRQLDDPESLCGPLGEALSSVYAPAQLRGKQCMVEHYRRADGADYFFAYLDDYPDKHLVFDGNDSQPVIDLDMPELKLAEFNGASIDTFRFESLEFFLGMPPAWSARWGARSGVPSCRAVVRAKHAPPRPGSRLSAEGAGERGRRALPVPAPCGCLERVPEAR